MGVTVTVRLSLHLSWRHCRWNMKELIAVLQMFFDIIMELVAVLGCEDTYNPRLYIYTLYVQHYIKCLEYRCGQCMYIYIFIYT